MNLCATSYALSEGTTLASAPRVTQSNDSDNNIFFMRFYLVLMMKPRMPFSSSSQTLPSSAFLTVNVFRVLPS